MGIENEEYCRGYKQGYTAGYQAGIEAVMQGCQTANIGNDISLLPIEAMELSSRAKNCLRKADCKTVGDVSELGAQDVNTMRNLGKVTGKEIATWLDTHGMPYTVWNQFI